MKRSLLVVAIGAALLFGVQLMADQNASAFTNVPWALSLAMLGVILAILGGMAYRLMLGAATAKFVLITLMVIIANGVAEIVIGSDQAYPRLTLWLIIPYVIACWVGAAIAIALAKLRGMRTGKESASH
jgi:hypothetical protein